MTLNVTDSVQLTLPSYFPIYLEVGVIAFVFFVLITTLFLAYRRLNYSVRFAVVALLNVLSFCALIGLISDVKLKTDTELAAVLLTYGTNQQQIDLLLVDKNTKVFILSTFYPLEPWQNSLDLSHLKNNPIIIDNATEVFLSQPSLSQLTVYGDGLLPQQWQMFHALSSQDGTIKPPETANNKRVDIDFSPSMVRTGPIQLSWPKQLVLGQPFYIKGKFRSAIEDRNRIYSIILSDLHDEVVDELVIKNNENFNLLASIKNQGLFTYQLKVFDDEQQLILSEPVAFTVSSSEQIKVVIKQSSASFESKYLKNWLAEQGEQILVLTQTSKNKYIQQKVNSTTDGSSEPKKDKTPQVVNKRLAAAWLKNIDLLYMDGRAFLALSEKEVSQLNVAITDGLGLIIIVDDELISSSNKMLNSSLLTNSPLGNSSLTNNTLQVSAKDERIINTVPSWLHSKEEHAINYISTKLPTEHGKVLIKGSEGQALWVNHSHGLGSIAFSLIGSSYKWRISGEKKYYSQYWQYIIEQVSRQKQNSGWQKSPKNTIYFQGGAQNVCAQLNTKDVDNVKAKQINLLVSAVTESTHCGVYWANTSGWHTLTLVDEESKSNEYQINTLSKKNLSSQSQFFYAQYNWQTWQQYVKHEASYLASEYPSNVHLDPVYIQVNKLIIWWLLFITLSLLWVERKAL